MQALPAELNTLSNLEKHEYTHNAVLQARNIPLAAITLGQISHGARNY